MNTLNPIVIVGAGHAGGRTALALRENGYQGPLVLIGEEFYLPYERPALSKQILLGDKQEQECYLCSAEALKDLNIEFLQGMSVLSIDAKKQEIKIANQDQIAYSKLVLAVGGKARQLQIAGSQLKGVYTLRTMNDAHLLKKQLNQAKRIAVIGGGFIGLEVAAAARVLGCEVTVLEYGDRLVSRLLPPVLSDKLLQTHQDKGVQVRLNSRIKALSGTDSVEFIILDNGDAIACDLVVVGVGIEPNIHLAQQAGLDIGNGIRVNHQLQTSDKAIYAVGDVCEFPDQNGQYKRLETWRNVEEQSAHAAKTLLGDDSRYDLMPWFWSDQYEFSLQLVGEVLPTATCLTRVLSDDAFLLFFMGENNQIQGACSWGEGNRLAKDIKVLERLIMSQKVVDPMMLLDASINLKKLLS